MSKTKLLLVLLSLGLFLQSCNEISTEQPLLTDENSSKLKLSKKYWNAEDADGDKAEFGIILNTADSKKQEWSFKMVPDKKRELSLSIRLKEIGRKRFIAQIKYQDKEDIAYALFILKKIKNDHYELLPYTAQGIKKAQNNAILNPFKEHVKTTSRTIKFDAFMTTYHKKEIIDFMTSLEEKTAFNHDKAFVLKGTNDKAVFDAILAEYKK